MDTNGGKNDRSDKNDVARYALVTGASSGIGLALAEVLAEHGYGLVLVARDQGKLDAAKLKLENLYAVPVRTIAVDLTAPDAAERVLRATDVAIDALVNNAGFGEYGPFAESDLNGQRDMVALNVTALMSLTRLVLPQMVQRRAGKILNIASTAAFQPGPRMAVYYASKAFVLSFSEALREEVRAQGIAVTALCPGPTESDFFKKQPTMTRSRLAHSMKRMSAARAAEIGYRALIRNRAVVIPGLRNRLLAWSTRFAPRAVVTKISRWVLEEGE